MKFSVIVTIGAAALAARPGAGRAAPANARRAGSLLKRKCGPQITDEEEAKMGEAVSEQIRQRYGVVQDPAVHRYVTLVGQRLARPAPGRAAVAVHRARHRRRQRLCRTRRLRARDARCAGAHSERGGIGGVLGHEIMHVTEQHTIKAIKKGKTGGDGAGGGRQSRLRAARRPGHRHGAGGVRPGRGTRGRREGHRIRQHGRIRAAGASAGS